MFFKASLDKTALVVTILITILFAGLIIEQYALIGDGGPARPVYTAGACGLIYLLAFAFRPTGYEVTPTAIFIRRPLATRHLRRRDIKQITLLPPTAMHGAVRTFGVGGLFGYFGRFAKAGLGSMTWYATRRDTPVLLETTTGRKLLLTPDQPSQFVAALTSQPLSA